MRRMFWKIFWSFWLAMSLIGVAFALVYLSNVPKVKRARKYFLTQHALQLHGMRMQRLLRKGKTSRALFCNRSLARKYRTKVFLFRNSKLVNSSWHPPQEVYRLHGLALAQGKAIKRVAATVDYYAIPLPSPPKSKNKDILVGTIHRPSRLEKYVQPRTLPLRLAILFVVAGLICYFLASLLTAPIQSLRRTAQRLADGELDARVAPEVGNLRDEIGDLGRDFDQMAARIQLLINAQTRLLRDISHELRSPLARLNVALGIARQKAGDTANGALDRIEREADRLNDLIGHILTITLLEDKSSPREPEPICFTQLVQQIVQDSDYEAKSRQRHVTLDAEEDIDLCGTPELLHQAVENVIRNAIRFTPPETEVEVTLKRITRPKSEGSGTEDAAELTVRDHGPGVPEEALTELFRPFFQVEDARSPNQGGTGLGLAITQRAVHLHNGTVEAQNAADGGLLFTMILPIKDS